MTMTRLRSLWLPVILQAVLGLAACGEDDDDDDGTPVNDAGPRDSGVDATVPRDAGSDASTDSGVTSVMCGAATCGPFMRLSTSAPVVEPCCYSGPLANGTTAANQCSGKYMGQCLPPAVADPCRDNITAFGMTLQGCCALNQQCGVNSNQTGLGCPDLATTEATIRGLMPSFTIPTASKRACAADAGTTSRVTFGMDAGF